LAARIFRRRPAQAIGADAILTFDRHRQPRRFLGAPARPRRIAGELLAAPGAGETLVSGFGFPKRFVISQNRFFISGSSLIAVYSARIIRELQEKPEREM
jgi:hypothetical protein